MVELMLLTPGSTFEIPVMLDAQDFEIPPLLGLDVLDGNSFLVDNLTNHLWNRIINNRDPLRFEDMWRIKLISKGGQLYVPLSIPIQLFSTMENLESFINNSLTHQ